MVFDRLRSALTGQPAGPGQQLKEALAPIRAVSEPLYQRTVGFVHDGSGPEVLLELDAAHQPDLERLLIEPGKVQSHTRWLTEAEKQKLRQAGIQADPKLIHDARSRYYRSTDSSQPQWLRFGYLLAALGSGPNRRVEGVPLWLTALLNDIATVINKGGLRYLQWPPERFADLLRHDGAAEADIPTIVFLAMSEQENVVGWQIVRPHELPGIDNYLLGFGHLIPPSAVRRLGAMARVGVAERATADLRVAQVLAPLLAELAIDKAKGARTAAVLALSQLPGPLQGAVLRPVLVTAPAATSGELVEYLARTDAGGALLDEAMAAGAQLGAAVEKANARGTPCGPHRRHNCWCCRRSTRSRTNSTKVVPSPSCAGSWIRRSTGSRLPTTPTRSSASASCARSPTPTCGRWRRRQWVASRHRNSCRDSRSTCSHRRCRRST